MSVLPLPCDPHEAWLGALVLVAALLSLGGLGLRWLTACVLVGALVLGCAPADRDASRFDPRERPVGVAMFRAHFATSIGASDRQRAVEAIRDWHFPSLQGQLAFPVRFHLGHPTGYATRTADVYVHDVATFDSPHQPQLARRGYLDGAGAIHVTLGACATVPDLTHQAVHAFFAPSRATCAESHALVPQLWTDVLAEQERTVRLIRVARGCP